MREVVGVDSNRTPGSIALKAKVLAGGEGMRVLLADEHAQVRWALRRILAEEPGLIVVGEASKAEALLSQAQVLQPDLILLEWELPGRPLEALLAARLSLDLRARIIVLGRRPETKEDALAAGADGFLSKADAPAQFLTALRQVLKA
jgi:DNA-binding NarL/FixJ family response regulator